MKNIHEVIVVPHQTAKIIVEGMRSNESSPRKKAFIRECIKTSSQVKRSEALHTLS
ncbi:hypothetical protein ACFQ88_22755 [Paenibacillus sp. NPDC056579]|uniref:hypothetical protein n=1 Tax=Paenibacillus sp. NPDC056579 TaxID=3345871 RepID=UPI0036AF9148